MLEVSVDSLAGEQFRTALDELLASETFVRSPALARLLTYLVEQVLAGEAASLKESVIGHVLYGRPASYDPKSDSVVRVSANRLRTRLEDHYRSQPMARARIVLPRGAYVPQLEIHEPAQTGARGGNEAGPAELPPVFPAPGSPAGQQVASLRVGRTGGSHRYQILLLAALIAAVFLLFFFWMRTHRPAVPTAATAWSVRPFARMGGSQQFGAFSPDGTSLAFTSATARHENKTIYIQATALEEAHRIAPGVRPAWSPDGKRLAFLRPEENGKKQVVLYSLPTGTQTVLTELEGADPWLCELPRLSWSRDGSFIYSSASTEGRSQCGIISINVENHQIRALLPPSSHIGDLEPAVSPDGTTIAFMRGLQMSVIDLFLVSTAGGEVHRVTHDGVDIVGFDWSSDGKSLIVASSRESGARRLWRMPIAGGPPQVLTDGSSLPTFPSVSPNGKEINFTQFHTGAPIWKLVDGKPIQILDNQSENKAPAVSPDGKKMLYSSDRSGRWEVWLSNLDGSDSRPLLRKATYDTGWPRWSFDGTRIVMECHSTGYSHVCVSNADGSGFHRLTTENTSQIQPSWSHDGRFVYFTGNAAGTGQIFRADVASGAVELITHRGGIRAIESWDGKWLYVSQALPRGGMVAVPVQGTEQERSAAENTPLLPEMIPNIGSAWDACKEGIVYRVSSSASSPQLAMFDPQTHRFKPLVELGEYSPETDISLGVLPDGQGIIFTVGETNSNLNMMVAR